MQKTALLSYLLYEDGKIVIDEISPKDKFGKVLQMKQNTIPNQLEKSCFLYFRTCYLQRIC